MGLIKKYQAGSQMNFSFDNNNDKQAKLLSKNANKNLSKNTNIDVDNTKSNTLENSVNKANFMFKPIDLDYSSVLENKTKLEQKNTQQNSNINSALSTGVQQLGVSAGKIAAEESAKAAASGATLSTAGTAAAAVSQLAGPVGVALAANKVLHKAGDSIQTDEYGNAKTKLGSYGKEMSHMLDWRNVKDGLESDGNILQKFMRAQTGAMGLNSSMRAYSRLTGNDKKTDGFWGKVNNYSGITAKNKKVDAEKAKIKTENDAENDKIAAEKKKFLTRAQDQNTYFNLSNQASNSSNIYKTGGKLIPKFRRGGVLDLEKENVILGGPSHDDHNKTGIKGDKGLPVVKKGVKVAEIESLELVLNKKSSVEIEKLTKEYKSTGDSKILDKIGKVMKKEINDNTYDYSKELL